MKKIDLNCALLNVYPPAPLFRIAVDVTKLHWSHDLRQFINELKQLIITIDDKYRLKAGKGRSIDIEITPRKVHERELRYALIPSVPGRVESALGNIRGRLYSHINEHAIYVHITEAGRKIKKLYFLPFSSIGKFVEKVNMLNKQIDEINQLIKRYVDEDLPKINELLKRYGLETIASVEKVKYISYDLMPIQLDIDVIKKYVSAEELKELEKAINEEKRKIIESAINNLKNRVKEIVSIAVTNTSQAFEQLQNIRRLAEDIGIASYISSQLDDLEQAITNPKKIYLEEASKRLNGRLKSFLEELLE